MALDGGGTLLDEFPGRVFPVEGDKAEVLGSIASHLVNRPDHLHHRTKLHKVAKSTDRPIKKLKKKHLSKVSSHFIVGELVGGQLAHVDLALSALRFLASTLTIIVSEPDSMI